MTFGCLTDADRVEVGALNEDVAGLHGNTRFFAAKDTGDAHGLGAVAAAGIANHKVAGIEFAFHAVESDEGGVLRQTAHHHLVALDHIGIESMKRLAHFHQNEIGDIDNIIDGAQTDGAQFVLKPIGRFLNLDVADSQTAVTRAEVRFFDSDADRLSAIDSANAMLSSRCRA